MLWVITYLKRIYYIDEVKSLVVVAHLIVYHFGIMLHLSNAVLQLMSLGILIIFMVYADGSWN